METFFIAGKITPPIVLPILPVACKQLGRVCREFIVTLLHQITDFDAIVSGFSLVLDQQPRHIL